MSLPFWRFAAMSDSRRELPAGVDAHRAISLVTKLYFSRLVAKHDVDVVALIFEASERGDTLVNGDYELARIDFRNMWGRQVEVEGCFMPKASQEPGLEVADLIAHTSARQRRHEIGGRSGHTKDFQQTYWHSQIPPEFTAITAAEISDAIAGGLKVPRH
jgi:hypothetical protein